MDGVSNFGDSLPEKVIFKQRPKGIKGRSHMDIWKKSVPTKRNSKCKGPETEVSLKWSRNSVFLLKKEMIIM